MSERTDTNASGEGKNGWGLYVSLQGQADFLLQEKIEKICHAVFYLTGHQDNRSDLVLVLEEHALTCVSLASYFCVTRKGRDELVTALLDIASLVRLSVTVGVVSEGSARVLVEEITKTVERILRAGALPSVSSDDLNVSGVSSDERPPLSASFKELFAAPALPAPIKDTSRTSKKDMRPRKNMSHTETLSDREGQVLSIVKEKGQVSIKDIALVIKGCSEKTLQRTLLGLVERGSLKKEGERRWSTYRLA
jgi:hypothetical protein